MIHKCVNELAQRYLCDLFTKRSDIHPRDTPSKDLLQIPKHKTSVVKGVFILKVLHFAIMWTLNIKSCLDSLKSFKKELMQSLMEQLYS